MVTKSFTAQVDDWVKKSQARIDAVTKESAKRVVSLAANAVPVDTGFARASIMASTSTMPTIKSGKGSPDRAYDIAGALSSVSLVIAGALPDQTIYVGWTAPYIVRLEYGHSKQAPSGFLRKAAAQWPRIVEQVTSEAKARAGS